MPAPSASPGSPRRCRPTRGYLEFCSGSALVTVGLLFKVSAVPFHSWVPDVYQGAPTPITAFMAAGTKIAAFGALLRIFYVALPALKDEWRPALWAIAILTMAVGTITAVTQRDIKRLLGYSAVAHTGFILTGVIALNPAGLTGTLFYLAAYGFATVGPSPWWAPCAAMTAWSAPGSTSGPGWASDSR